MALAGEQMRLAPGMCRASHSPCVSGAMAS